MSINLTSTHPPLAERIRILPLDGRRRLLRQLRWQPTVSLKNTGGIISPKTAAAAATVGLRAAVAGGPVETLADDKVSRTRQRQ